MNLSMSNARIAELVVAVVLLAAGIWFYRRRDKADQYGSQGAVILFVIATIMAIHALGGLDYHPTEAEADMFRSGAR